MNEDELAELLEEGLAPGHPGEGTEPGAPTRAAAEEVRRVLGEQATWAEPDPAGADALLAAIRAELPAKPIGGPPAPVGDAEPSDEGAPPAGTRRPRHRPGDWFAPPASGPDRRPLLALVAAVALVALGVVGGLALAPGDSGDGGDTERGTEVALAGTELAPGASALARVEETGSGVEVWMSVEGLPPAEDGTYYQAWVRGPEGAVTVGTFHMRGGDEPVVLWSGVDVESYPTLTVTLQVEGAGAESSGQVVLAGEIAP